MRALTTTIAAVLLIFGVVADAANAAQRGASPPRTSVPKDPEERRAETTKKMEAWLRGLVGRYYVFDRVTPKGTLKKVFKDGKLPDGTVWIEFVDCVGIGSGPGVLCMWYHTVHKPGGENLFRVGALLQLGLDPNASRIRILMMQDDQWQESIGESSAELSGDTVRWQAMPCNLEAVELDCQRTLQISQPRGADYSVWAYGSRINLSEGTGLGTRLLAGAPKGYMYRLPPGAGEGPDGLPRPMADPTQEVEVEPRARPPGPR